MVRSASLLLASAALALGLASATDVQVHVRVHHHHKHTAKQAPTTPVLTQAPRKVFGVTGSKAAFDQLLTPAMQSKLGLDVWRMARAGHGQMQAKIMATDEAMAKLQAGIRNHAQTKTHGKGHGSNTAKLQVKLGEEEDEATIAARIAQDRKDVAACLNTTRGYQADLKTADSYTDNAYFDCFRPYEDISVFFDTLTKLNPDFVTKIHNVSKTFEGHSIHAYKLSTSATTSTHRLKQDTKIKRAVFTQSLVHAREWQGGASMHYTFASMVDDLRAGDADALALLADVDWYFVPIVNIDGYKYSWDVDRYWRANRHSANGFEGVDLNRNYPAVAHAESEDIEVTDETNPGDKPLSEPSTKGIYDYLTVLPGLIGFVDVHAYGGLVLRPFGDLVAEPQEPYGSKLKHLGDSVRDAMSPKDAFQYVSQPSAEFYPAFGCADDAIFRGSNFSVATLTIEVEGDDFIAPQTTIRDVGENVSNGLRTFVEEAQTYHKFILGLKAAKN